MWNEVCDNMSHIIKRPSAEKLELVIPIWSSLNVNLVLFEVSVYWQAGYIIPGEIYPQYTVMNLI